MPAYSHFDYYLRSIVTAILSLGIIGVAAYDQVAGSNVAGPFKDWAALIIGVYFGSHVAMNGAGARRKQAQAEIEPTVVPVALKPEVLPVQPPSAPPVGA